MAPTSGKASWQITATAIDDQGGSRTSAALELRAETTSAFKFIEAAPLSPVYVEQNGLGSVQLQVATDPSIVQIQGPSGLWDRSNMQAWTVDLFESGALVDTQRFGYENVATLPADPTSYQQAWQWNGGGYVVYRAPRPFVRSQLAPGTYTYTLQLTPNYGGTWRAAPFTVSVAAREPTIRISAPSANTSLYQGNVSVALEVSGPTPVTDAILKENGVEIGRCVVVSPNVSSGFYRTGSCTVRWLSASVGSHTLVANIGDSEGHAATSTR